MRILLVEDDATLRDGLTQSLQDSGHATVAVDNGAAADLLLATETFDLLVLDLGLPKLDGFAVLDRLRRRRQMLPVLIVSARDHTHERVLGLDRGADDYLAKPFELSEFEARVRALLRRGQAATVVLGGLAWSWDTRQAMGNGVPLALTRHEINLLEALIQTNGRTVPKTTLTTVLGEGNTAADNLVEVYISRLRRKLAPTGVEIGTVRGVGYRLLLAAGEEADHGR